MSKLNWGRLYFGHVYVSEVQKAIKDPEWQKLRKDLKGRSLEEKYERLLDYYQKELLGLGSLPDSEFWGALRMLQVRCTNYVTALSRGGLISPSDYREQETYDYEPDPDDWRVERLIQKEGGYD